MEYNILSFKTISKENNLLTHNRPFIECLCQILNVNADPNGQNELRIGFIWYKKVNK